MRVHIEYLACLGLLLACTPSGNTGDSGGDGRAESDGGARDGFVPVDAEVVCEHPPSQAVSAPCCPTLGPDACGAGLFCGAFDGRRSYTCYADGSRQIGDTCTADAHCATRYCDPATSHCLGGVDDACVPEDGCRQDNPGTFVACHPESRRCFGSNGERGSPCRTDTQCRSDRCLDGACDCSPTERPGYCAALRAEPCPVDGPCAEPGGECLWLFDERGEEIDACVLTCAADADCGDGGPCVVPAFPICRVERGPGRIAVSPNPVSVPPEGGESLVFIRNTGDGPLTVSELQLDMPRLPEPEFAVRADAADDLPWIIAPSGQVLLSVIYQPQAGGAGGGILRLLSDDPATPVTEVGLFAGGAASLSVTPSPVDFTPLDGARPITRTVRFTATGALSVNVLALSFEQEGDEYRLGGVDAFQVQPDQARTLDVVYTPRGPGSDAVLVVETDADNAVDGRLRVPLLGRQQD